MGPDTPKLLDRDTFRQSVLTRDKHSCVICHRPISDKIRLDAHHIMERRLFTVTHESGGYFLDNGATLCDDGSMASCHLRAEATLVSCEEIRKATSINNIILPDHLYADQKYTKWGDPLLDDGRRMRGELFQDESVHKILSQGVSSISTQNMCGTRALTIFHSVPKY